MVPEPRLPTLSCRWWLSPPLPSSLTLMKSVMYFSSVFTLDTQEQPPHVGSLSSGVPPLPLDWWVWGSWVGSYRASRECLGPEGKDSAEESGQEKGLWPPATIAFLARSPLGCQRIRRGDAT